MLSELAHDGEPQRRAPKGNTKFKLAMAEEAKKAHDGRLTSLSDDVSSWRARKVQAKQKLEDTKELLKETFAAVSHDRAEGATLVFDLDRARREPKVVEVEVKECEAMAEVEERATAAVRERVRWMRQMTEALKTARVEVESSNSDGAKSFCCMTREANEQEDRYCGELLPDLGRYVAEAASYEVEHGVLVSEAKQFRERAAVEDRDLTELSRRHDAAKADLRQVEAANGELTARIASFRAKVAAAEEGYQRLWEEDHKVHAVIKMQQVGMSDLRTVCRGHVDASGRVVAETIQRHLQVVGQRGLPPPKRASEPRNAYALGALPAEALPYSARGRPEPPPLSAPATVTLPQSPIPEMLTTRPPSQQHAAPPSTPPPGALQARPVSSSSTMTAALSHGATASANSPLLGSARAASGAAGPAGAVDIVELAAARAASSAGRARPLTPRSSLAKIAAAAGEPSPLAPRLSSASETPRPTSAVFRQSRGVAPAPSFDFRLPELSPQQGVAQVLKGGLGAPTAASASVAVGGAHSTPRGLGQAGQLVVGRASPAA